MVEKKKYKATLINGQTITFEDGSFSTEDLMDMIFDSNFYNFDNEQYVNTRHILYIEVLKSE